MQTGKSMMESAKETASNIAASAKSGLEKTKATAQEKVDKMRAHDDYEKDQAAQIKDDRMAHAEFQKQEAYAHNAASKNANTAASGSSYSHSATGATGKSTGGHQMSALPGHGSGNPAGGGVVEGSAATHPIGRGTGTARPTTAYNTHVGGQTQSGLTGPGYTG